MLNELAFASRNKHERHFHPQLRVLQPSNSILEISVVLKKIEKNEGEKSRKTMVFCYQNFSDLLWEKNVLVIKKFFWNSKLKAENCNFFEIIRTIYSNSEGSEQFLLTQYFFNLLLEISHI
jgi:hypothetical protein